MTTYNEHPIPTRLRLSQAVAKTVAKLLMDRLMAGWGLPNTRKIVATLSVMLRAEKARRKKLEDKR